MEQFIDDDGGTGRLGRGRSAAKSGQVLDAGAAARWPIASGHEPDRKAGSELGRLSRPSLGGTGADRTVSRCSRIPDSSLTATSNATADHPAMTRLTMP